MKKNLSGPSGLTLLEVILATAIFSILTGIIFYIFSVSSGGWLKARKTVEIQESAQILLVRIEKLISSSAIESIEVTNHTISGTPDPNDAISFLSALDPATGRTEYDTSGEMRWKKFVIFYLEDDPEVVPEGYYQLWSREVDLGDYKDNFGTAVISTLPYPPKLIPPGTPVSFITYITMVPDIYTSIARPVVRNITFLNFIPHTSERTVEIEIRGGKPVNPKDAMSPPAPERLKLRTLVGLRNK